MLLITDATPLSLLANCGTEGLNWLFALKLPVVVTDMVKEEVIRDPDPSADQRKLNRTVLRDWFEMNDESIEIVETRTGSDYFNAMDLWERARKPADAKPRWRDRGDFSLLELIHTFDAFDLESETAVVLIDDIKARAAIGGEATLNVDMIGTRALLHILETQFEIAGAGTAWQTIRSAQRNKVPDTLNPRPEIVRPGT